MKRFFKNIWDWCKRELTDKTTLIIFLIVFLIMSSPIYLGYIFGIVLDNKILLGIASGYWLFWIGPGTPFFPLCLGITIGVREIIRKVVNWKCRNQ